MPGLGFMMRVFLSLSYPFYVGIFSFIRCVSAAQLVSRFCSKGIAVCVAIDSLSVGEGKFRKIPSGPTNPIFILIIY